MYDPLQVIAGQRGTKLVKTSATGIRFRGFQVDQDAVFSVLTSKKDDDESYDALEDHIEGGNATTVHAGTTKMCQQDYFTGYTLTSGQINLIL